MWTSSSLLASESITFCGTETWGGGGGPSYFIYGHGVLSRSTIYCEGHCLHSVLFSESSLLMERAQPQSGHEICDVQLWYMQLNPEAV